MTVGKVLVIEDEVSWQNIIQRALEGYDLQITSDAEEAKQALDQSLTDGSPFLVITLDITLEPDHKEGFDKSAERLLTYIKKYHRYVKCVVVTGTADMRQVSNYQRKYPVFLFQAFSKDTWDAEAFREVIDSIFHIGKYRKIKELGRGGGGIVYQVQDTETKARLALKELYNTVKLDRFKQEAKIVQSMEHDHIVKVVDYVIDEDDNEPSYIVMEYIEGSTLNEILTKEYRLPIEEVIKVGIQLLDALDYAHSRNIVHRDINPSNLIFTGDGKLKVTDFGIAKVMDSNEQLTRTSERFGTEDYMPIEQLRSAKIVDHRADIYTAGLVLHKALTGLLPYEITTYKMLPESFTAAGLSSVPEEMEALIFKMIEDNREARPQSARAVCDILENLLETYDKE